MKKYLEIYCDGGYYKELNLVKWAFLIIENNEDILYSESGSLNGSGGFDVERAESEAIFKALYYCREFKGNYILYTDSRSVLDKIENKVPNATKNPRIAGIQNLIKDIRECHLPSSIALKYFKRRSNKWMQEVDDRCYKEN
jgi:ribonuclease HI